MDINTLRTRLKAVSAPRLAQASGVAGKTIYRIRDGFDNPTLRTVAALVHGLERLRAADQVEPAHTAAPAATEAA